MKAKQKIPKISLEDLNKLAKGKKIFEFRPHLRLSKSYVPTFLIGEEFHSISNALTIEDFILICPERDSYLKTILEFFPINSDCAKWWELSKIQFGVETLVKIGDPHKNRVTPIGIYEHSISEKYALLKVSEEISLLFKILFTNSEMVWLIEPISE